MKYAILAVILGFGVLMNTVSYADARKGETVSPAEKFNQLSHTNQINLRK